MAIIVASGSRLVFLISEVTFPLPAILAILVPILLNILMPGFCLSVCPFLTFSPELVYYILHLMV